MTQSLGGVDSAIAMMQAGAPREVMQGRKEGICRRSTCEQGHANLRLKPALITSLTHSFSISSVEAFSLSDEAVYPHYLGDPLPAIGLGMHAWRSTVFWMAIVTPSHKSAGSGRLATIR
jgi:hypothetical protein